MTHESSDAKRSFAVEVVERLRSQGFQAFWAGGCVRDFLMGHAPSDYDVATNARPEQVMKLFRRTFAVGVSFGVIVVLGDGKSGDIEVATFRSDGVYSDGRRPESVVFSTAEFDASRRDFTINGMFYDPIAHEVIDYVGGRADLENKLLRAIGDPFARFTEDKLRLLRAVRFAARFGLVIEPTTRAAIEQMANQVTQVAQERIGQEWRKMLVHPSRVQAVELADTTGLLPVIIPQTASLKLGNAEAWRETLRVLAALPESPSFPLALAAFLRLADESTGEVQTSTTRIKHGHDPLIMKIAQDLKLANHERDLAAWLVHHEDALLNATVMRKAMLKRLLASPATPDLLALHAAIAQATTGDLTHIEFCESYIRNQPDGPIDPPPLLTGHDLTKHGLKPGPRFAELLETVRDAQLEGTIDSKEAGLTLVDQLIAPGPA